MAVGGGRGGREAVLLFGVDCGNADARFKTLS